MKDKFNVMQIVDFFYTTFKKQLIICIIINIILCIYCFPISIASNLDVIKAFIGLVIFYSFILLGEKFNDFTDATIIFAKKSSIFIYSEFFLVVGFLILATIFGLIGTINTKDISRFSIVLPTIIGVHFTCKIVYRHIKVIAENKDYYS